MRNIALVEADSNYEPRPSALAPRAAALRRHHAGAMHLVAGVSRLRAPAVGSEVWPCRGVKSNR